MNGELFSPGLGDFAAIAREVLGRGKSLSFRARGRSMHPFIQDGDIVTVSPQKGSLTIGDVVLVEAGTGRVILHRIVKRQRAGVVTRGDAAFVCDDLIAYGNVLGSVSVVSGRGHAFHLKNPFKYMIARNIIPLTKIFRKSLVRRLIKKAIVSRDQERLG